MIFNTTIQKREINIKRPISLIIRIIIIRIIRSGMLPHTHRKDHFVLEWRNNGSERAANQTTAAVKK